jgi:hypothetical protein
VAHMTAETSRCGKKRNTEGTEIGTPLEAPLEARGKRGEQRPQRGYHPRGDRKSAETLENRRDRGLPLRKSVCNCMKIQGLNGCNRR